MTPFSQKDWISRCEWGVEAVNALAPADVVIVVDVFSFSTSVDVAVSRGVTMIPYSWNGWDDPAAVEFARVQGAELAGKRRRSRYSLAPKSYVDAPAGLRCVLPSPNGARVSLAAAPTGSLVLTGCLRNARAIAEFAQQAGRTFNVIPSGERWRDGTLRPALEDALGAGAILSWLPGPRSPEAEAAIAIFERYRDNLVTTLDACGSGRELDERGHQDDKVLAGALDVSACVPRFDGIGFVDGR